MESKFLAILNETLILGLKDSAPAGGVTRYRAAEGARPVISGGRVIDQWKMSQEGIAIKGLNTATGNFFINSQLSTGGAGNTVDPDSELSRNVFYHTSTKGFLHDKLRIVKAGLDYNLYYHAQPGQAEAMFAAQKEASQTKLSDKHSIVADPMF